MSRSFFRTYGFLSAMLLAIVLGCVLGALWPGATCLAPLGTIFINLMFCIVVPLVFCSLSSSIACMKSPKRAGRIMGTTLLVFIVTGLIAAVIMLFAMRLYPRSSNRGRTRRRARSMNRRASHSCSSTSSRSRISRRCCPAARCCRSSSSPSSSALASI